MVLMFPVVASDHCAHVDAWNEAGRLRMIERRNAKAIAEYGRYNRRKPL